MIITVSLLALALAAMTGDECYVAAPAFVCMVMVLWLFMTLWDRDGQIPVFDVGVLCAFSTLVYTVFPLVNYWVGGMQFGFRSDARLRTCDITPLELGIFHLRHVLYLLVFVVVYSWRRGRGRLEVGNVRAPSPKERWVIIFYWLMIMGGLAFLRLLTQGSDGLQDSSRTYGEKVAMSAHASASLPLIIRQAFAKLTGILLVFKLGVLAIVFHNCRRRYWRVLLLVWTAGEIAITLYDKGARTDLVMFLMAAALFYHRMIKSLSLRFLTTAGFALFAFFILFGVYRSNAHLVSLQARMSQTQGGILSESNEFQALLGTEYDIYRRKMSGAEVPWYIYINDFIGVLPPQQLLSFEKIPASEWYLREIGLAGTGLGFMWGVITQSIAGLDWPEIACRAAVLGYVLAELHRWYLKYQFGFLATVLYVFMCLVVYYTFRNTTFSPLTNLVWQVIPAYIILRVGVAILPRGGLVKPGS